MKGIYFITDENDNRIAIQINYEQHGDIIEDLLDHLLIESRKKEGSVPLNDVVSELREEGNLDKCAPKDVYRY